MISLRLVLLVLALVCFIGATVNVQTKMASGHYANGCNQHVDHTQCTGLEVGDGEREQQLRQDAESLPPGLLPFAPGPNDPRWPVILAERPALAPALESQIRGVADGVPDWMDRAMSNRTKRLGRLGNAVVPDCAEWIGRKILEFENSYASF